jgi:hypothetical protein
MDDLVGSIAMFDVEFLQAPNAGPKLVYIYRSGRLRRAMREALAFLAEAQGLMLIEHLAESFGAELGGFFHGFHWSDLGDAKTLVAEAAMETMLAYDDGPAAIFVSASSALLRASAWSRLQRLATVVEEPLPTPDTLEAIVEFGLKTSDLSPAADLSSNPTFSSYLRERIHLYGGIDDVLADIDDYILTRHDRPALFDVQPRIPEFALVTVLRSFVEGGGPSEERRLLDQVLLRGDDEKLVLGALTTSTITLLRQYRRKNETGLDTKGEALLRWACTLLAGHLGAAVLLGGNAPSWRGNPDGRQYLVAQLCRDFRRSGLEVAHRTWLVQQAGEALERVPVLAASDEQAARRLGEAMSSSLEDMRGLPPWGAEMARALRPGKSPPLLALDFNARLETIKYQPLVVEQLKRRVAKGAFEAPVLLCGAKSDELGRLVAAWTKAVLCKSQTGGDACDRCESCRDLTLGGSAAYAVGRLEISPSQEYQQKQTGWAADRQLQEVRRLVFNQGLWLGRRVVILDGVDKVRKQALDRLLKAIEEAPSAVSFVFLAERQSRVPAALRSRSQAMAIKRSSSEAASVA